MVRHVRARKSDMRRIAKIQAEQSARPPRDKYADRAAGPEIAPADSAGNGAASPSELEAAGVTIEPKPQPLAPNNPLSHGCSDDDLIAWAQYLRQWLIVNVSPADLYSALKEGHYSQLRIAVPEAIGEDFRTFVKILARQYGECNRNLGVNKPSTFNAKSKLVESLIKITSRRC